MTTKRVVLADAFTTEPFSGDPAGVVLDAGDLTEDQRRRIARELSVSETAFVGTDGDGNPRLWFLTPTAELDRSGPATLAALGALFADGSIETGEHTLKTNFGTLETVVDDDGRVWMARSIPQVESLDLDRGPIATALGIDPGALEAVGETLPVARAIAGRSILLVPIPYLEQLGTATPDDGDLEDLCERTETEGVYAFTFDTIDADASIHGRAFLPGAGFAGDPDADALSVAACRYLDDVGALDPMPEALVVERGHFEDRPGRVHVGWTDEVVDGDARGRRTVAVGGYSARVLEGSIVVPPVAANDIVDAS